MFTQAGEVGCLAGCDTWQPQSSSSIRGVKTLARRKGSGACHPLGSPHILGPCRILSSKMALKKLGAHSARPLSYLKSIQTNSKYSFELKDSNPLEPINCHIMAAVMYCIRCIRAQLLLIALQ